MCPPRMNTTAAAHPVDTALAVMATGIATVTEVQVVALQLTTTTTAEATDPLLATILPRAEATKIRTVATTLLHLLILMRMAAHMTDPRGTSHEKAGILGTDTVRESMSGAVPVTGKSSV